jgi:hypothetical protein
VLRKTLSSIVFVTAVLLVGITQSSVAADESILQSTSTTVVDQFDEESGLIWSQIDDHTIELSLPD